MTAAPTFLVTGANGYMAQEIVVTLLKSGFDVRATVRSAASAKRCEHLLKIAEGMGGKLKLYTADLTSAEGLREAVTGCTYVIHPASPNKFVAEDVMRDIVEPAVNCTKVVLVAAAGAKVKRVVYTSTALTMRSFAEIAEPPTSIAKDGDWNDKSTAETDPYSFSKVQAEKVAWELAEQLDLDLVAILPSGVFGVTYTPAETSSINMMKALIENTGELAVPVLVATTDVAHAHMLAAIKPQAKGRYLLDSGFAIPPQDVAAIMRQAMPEYSWKAQKSWPKSGLQRWSDSKRIEELGMKLAPPEEFLPVMARCLIRLGVATPVPAVQSNGQH